MIIFVRIISGELLTINIEPSFDSIATIKTRIEEKTGVSPYHQKLIFAGKALED